MRMNSGEGNSVCLAGRSSQKAARIARSAGNLAISRAFLRAALTSIITRVVGSIARISHR
jgi:hypothetical protein